MVTQCQEVNKKHPKNLTSLTHMELMESIRKPQPQMFGFINIKEGIKSAHTNTLSRWLTLVSTERESTFCRKWESNRQAGKMNQISTYFWRRI